MEEGDEAHISGHFGTPCPRSSYLLVVVLQSGQLEGLGDLGLVAVAGLEHTGDHVSEPGLNLLGIKAGLVDSEL